MGAAPLCPAPGASRRCAAPFKFCAHEHKLESKLTCKKDASKASFDIYVEGKIALRFPLARLSVVRDGMPFVRKDFRSVIGAIFTPSP